jgi:hypothetical protein
MLKLDLKNAPYELELVSGVSIEVEPATTPVMRELYRDSFAANDGEGEDDVAFAKRIARRVILSWKGIGDETGKAVKPTPERIDALMNNHAAFKFFEKNYIVPAVVLVDEGNVSRTSPSGTTAGGKPIARGAKASAKSARKKSTNRKR